MARSDSFFIRASCPTTVVAYNEVAIDLGSYVNVLSKDILRIHNIHVEYGTPAEAIGGLTPNIQSETNFQVTTQSQTALVPLSNRSVVASGQLTFACDANLALSILDDNLNAGPQDWTSGYLIAVESLFLGVDQGVDALSQVSIIMECTSETMSQAAAMALSLSQQ